MRLPIKRPPKDEQVWVDLVLRALSVCGRFTTWEWLVPQCQGIMRAFLRSMLARATASGECPKPVWGWKEENPICASPLCGGYTGLWLP